MICKKFELGRGMSRFYTGAVAKHRQRDAKHRQSHVADARKWAQELVTREVRGWGDLPRAMRRVSERCGIDFSILHALRYRPPKGVDVSVYERLEAAYLAMCEKQDRLRRHERALTTVKNPLAASLVRAADALARPKD
jgi:hypothetical protein